MKITRREMLARLGWCGAGLATGLAAGRCGGGPDISIPWPINEPELVTIGPDRLALTWVTDTPRATCLRLAREGEGFSLLSPVEGERTFHYVEVDGLEAGTRYRYELTTAEAQRRTTYSPGEAMTLTPLSGRRVTRFATLNDIHTGCDEVGLIDGHGTPFSWPDAGNPHWRFAAEAAVREINERGVEFVVVKGDLTTFFTRQEFEWAREILDGLEAPYYPVRGNHDRVGDNVDDFFLETFGDLLPLRASSYVFERAGLRFVCLDSSHPATGESHIPPENVAWVDDALRGSASSPTFLVMHHPVDSGTVGWMGLTAEQRAELLEVLAPQDHLVGVLSGHTHRDQVTRQPELGPVPCIETAATLHYPSGYTIYDVHEDGYMQVCYRMRCDECLEWNEMTKELYAGLGRSILFFSAERRCFVHRYS